jgi:hypothetical protein
MRVVAGEAGQHTLKPTVVHSNAASHNALHASSPGRVPAGNSDARECIPEPWRRF